MASVFHELTDLEIAKQLEEAKSEIRELRFAYATTRSLADPSRVGKLKRNIARMMTVLRERQMGKTDVKPKTEKKSKVKKKKEEAKA